MKSGRLPSKLLLLCVILLGSVILQGQSQPNLENGFKPYGSYVGGGIDTVNLMNGNLMLNIPAPFHYPQRGKLDPRYAFYLTSKNWTVQCVPNSQSPTGLACQWIPGVAADCIMPAQATGSRYQVCAFPTGVGLTDTLALTVKRTVENNFTGDGVTIYDASGYSLVTPDLAVHGLAASGPLDSTGESTQFESLDGSGFRVQLSNPDNHGIMSAVTVIDRAGNRYLGTFPPSDSGITGFRDPFDGVQPSSGPGGTYMPLANGSGGGPNSDYFFGQLATFSSATDANGNVFNLSTSTDTLGHAPPSAPATTDTSDCVSPLAISGVVPYAYYGPNGTNLIKFCYSTFSSRRISPNRMSFRRKVSPSQVFSQHPRSIW
jgi:hypothetical protein